MTDLSRRAMTVGGGALWGLGVGLVIGGMFLSWTGLDLAALSKTLGIDANDVDGHAFGTGAFGGVLTGDWAWDAPLVGLAMAAAILILMVATIWASPRARRRLVAGGVLAAFGVVAATATVWRALDERDPELGVRLDWPGPLVSGVGAAAMIAGGAVLMLGGRRPRRGPVPQTVS